MIGRIPNMCVKYGRGEYEPDDKPDWFIRGLIVFVVIVLVAMPSVGYANAASYRAPWITDGYSQRPRQSRIYRPNSQRRYSVPSRPRPLQPPTTLSPTERANGFSSSGRPLYPGEAKSGVRWGP